MKFCGPQRIAMIMRVIEYAQGSLDETTTLEIWLGDGLSELLHSRYHLPKCGLTLRVKCSHFTFEVIAMR
jgi:hypothetical protein